MESYVMTGFQTKITTTTLTSTIAAISRVALDTCTVERTNRVGTISFCIAVAGVIMTFVNVCNNNNNNNNRRVLGLGKSQIMLMTGRGTE